MRRGVACLLVCVTVAACRHVAPTSDTHRVVSLSPSTTEALAAVGARDDLVGRSRYCDYPPDVKSVREVGGFVDPNFEAIVALRPDLVVGARGPSGPALSERLAAMGINTYFPETETLAGIDVMIAGLGERTGHTKEAADVVSAVDRRVAEVHAATEKAPRPRTLLVFGLGPIVVAGPTGFADEMLRGAGGQNVVTEGSAYPTLGMERILALAPDVILDATMQESHGEERIGTDAPGWRELTAVKQGRVTAIRDESVLRPGPRVGEGMATLARAIHPGMTLP